MIVTKTSQRLDAALINIHRAAQMPQVTHANLSAGSKAEAHAGKACCITSTVAAQLKLRLVGKSLMGSRAMGQGRSRDRDGDWDAEVSRQLQRELVAFRASPGGQEWARRRDALPVAQIREPLLAALEKSDVAVVSGDTGSGKTTQVCLRASQGRGLRCWEQMRGQGRVLLGATVELRWRSSGAPVPAGGGSGGRARRCVQRGVHPAAPARRHQRGGARFGRAWGTRSRSTWGKGEGACAASDFAASAPHLTGGECSLQSVRSRNARIRTTARRSRLMGGI